MTSAQHGGPGTAADRIQGMATAGAAPDAAGAPAVPRAAAWPRSASERVRAHGRALLRCPPAALLTIATGVLQGFLRPLEWPAPRLRQGLQNLTLRAWARAMTRLVGMRLEVVGEPPRPPFLLVANHLSYLDIIALWTRAEGDFLAKSEIAGWPIFGPLTRASGTLFVDRTRAADLPRVLGLLRGVLDRRRGVIFFPEGTSSDGAGVLPFRPSLFETALATGHPVHCASIAYATAPGLPPARLSVCWWGDMGFLGHLWRLTMLPGFEARLVFEPEPVRGASRKELARHAHELVTRHFVPVTGNPGAP